MGPASPVYPEYSYNLFPYEIGKGTKSVTQLSNNKPLWDINLATDCSSEIHKLSSIALDQNFSSLWQRDHKHIFKSTKANTDRAFIL